jgi:hypothetical protein
MRAGTLLHILKAIAFITSLLLHIYQKRKIAPEIAAKIASVNRLLERLSFHYCIPVVERWLYKKSGCTAAWLRARLKVKLESNGIFQSFEPGLC